MNCSGKGSSCFLAGQSVRVDTTETTQTAQPAEGHMCGTTPPPTPTVMSTEVHELVDEIRSTHETLSRLTSLAPSPRVNDLLGGLVSRCVQPYTSEFASRVLAISELKAILPDLRSLCSAAEGALESCWANRILDSAQSFHDPASQCLRSFPYYQNYIDLSRLEAFAVESYLSPAALSIKSCSSASSCQREPRHICFIGSGPLPMTSFCMLDRYTGSHVHNIDCDASALRISARLAKALGYERRTTFACEDVTADTSPQDTVVRPSCKDVKADFKATIWEDFDVVFLAALVGMDNVSKTCILESLAKKLRPGTLVVVRSAHGLRSVLYPIFELGDGVKKAGYEILAEVHPWTEVVNSIILLRVRDLAS